MLKFWKICFWVMQICISTLISNRNLKIIRIWDVKSKIIILKSRFLTWKEMMKNQIKFKNQINRTCPFKSKLVGNPRNFKKCQLKFKTIKSYKILSFLKIFKEYTRLGLLKNLINKKKTKSFNKKKKSKF